MGLANVSLREAFDGCDLLFFFKIVTFQEKAAKIADYELRTCEVPYDVSITTIRTYIRVF